MRTAIDSNIISALWSQEPSCSQVLPLLDRARQDGGLVICAVVRAELMAHPKATPDFVDAFLAATNILVDYQFDKAMWSDAGQRFAAYARRRRKSKQGEPKRLLADFLVGSHARASADRLLTLDVSRYENDYPDLPMMA